MNRAEANSLLMRAARQWPGKVAVNREVLDAWTNALADMHTDDGQAAYDAHVRDCPHPCTPADLWAAHRRTSTNPTGRPEIAPPTIGYAPAHEQPDVAAAEIAKARAIVGPSRYQHPGFAVRRGGGRKLDPAKAAAAQTEWDRRHNPTPPLEPGEP